MTASNPALRSDNLFNQLTDFVKRTLKTLEIEWRSHQEYTRVFHELSRLSDRELADINVNRFDIQQLAKDSAADIKKRHLQGA